MISPFPIPHGEGMPYNRTISFGDIIHEKDPIVIYEIGIIAMNFQVFYPDKAEYIPFTELTAQIHLRRKHDGYSYFSFNLACILSGHKTGMPTFKIRPQCPILDMVQFVITCDLSSFSTSPTFTLLGERFQRT